MQTYVSLLRGINVSGKNLIKMEVLRQIFTGLGFKEIKTYLQSGNVLFSAEKESQSVLQEKISSEIARASGIQCKVFVYKKEEWLKIAEKNPFLDEDESQLYITFLDDIIDITFLEKFKTKTTKGEKFHLEGKQIYLCYPQGYGLSKLDNNAIEAITRKVASTRNRKTVNALRDMLQV